jgi:hypothetical protein
LNTWHHACGVFAGQTSRSVYLDAAGKQTGTVDVPLSDYNVTNIGVLGSGAILGNYWDGDLAHAAIWNVALTDAEVASLAIGFSPLFVRPQNLLAYWPLLRSDNDIVGGYHMTAFNGPTWIDQPPIIMPAAPFISFPTTDVGVLFPLSGILETFTGVNETSPPNANWTNS